MASPWFHPRGELAGEGWQVVVDGRLPGWRYTGLRVGEVSPGAPLVLDGGATERMIVPLEGSVTIEHDGAGPGIPPVIETAPRRSVFHGPGDAVYLGVGVGASLTGRGRVAVAEAPAEERIPVQVMRASAVPVELRGAGASSRQVHNLGVPGALRAQRLIVCEVVTPSGNWSSHPAHKHDVEVAGAESQLEEIYYFEAAIARGAPPSERSDPIGTFTVRSSEAGEIDLDATVRTGDTVLVPYGYHGPAGAVPGYDLYYLNVMAGPGRERAWRIRDDPDQAWVRAAWADETVDPRLPYTAGPTGAEPTSETEPR